MNRIKDFVLCICLALVGAALIAYADTGQGGATRIERGSYGGAWAVSVLATPTKIADWSTNRPDISCMNNTAGTLYLIPLATMTYTSGFPVLSSATFTNDAFTGVIWGVCDTAKAPCDVRCWSGNVY